MADETIVAVEEKNLYLESLSQAILKEIKDTWRYRYVVSTFVKTNLSQKYRRSALGFLWTLGSPILQYGVIVAVFMVTMKIRLPNYISYAFFAAIAYSLMASVVNNSPMIMIYNEAFIKKIYVPKLVFILNIVLFEATNVLLSFFALIIIATALGQFVPSWALLFLPFSIIITLVMLTGLSTIISISCVFFRDLGFIFPVMMQAFFFLTPIYYSADLIPAKFAPLVTLNPFYHYVALFRYPTYYCSLPPMTQIIFCSVTAICVFTAGLVTLKLFDNKIVFRL